MSDLLFLVSAPRSGSTFLCRALDAHPEISMTVEAGWVALLRKAEALATTPAMEPIDDGEGFRTVGVVPRGYVPHTTAAFRASAKTFVAAFHESVGGRGRFLGDKVHSHNDAAFLVRTFPDVRLVYLVRDLRDVLVSTYTFQQKQATAWQEASFGARCAHLATFCESMGELLSGRAHALVRYEELVADPAGQLVGLFRFLGLEVAPEVDEWLGGEAAALFASHGTSATPGESIGRWRTMLTDEQKTLVEQVLAPHLRRLGYS